MKRFFFTPGWDVKQPRDRPIFLQNRELFFARNTKQIYLTLEEPSGIAVNTNSNDFIVVKAGGKKYLFENDKFVPYRRVENYVKITYDDFKVYVESKNTNDEHEVIVLLKLKQYVMSYFLFWLTLPKNGEGELVENIKIHTLYLDESSEYSDIAIIAKKKKYVGLSKELNTKAMELNNELKLLTKISVINERIRFSDDFKWKANYFEMSPKFLEILQFYKIKYRIENDGDILFYY